MANRNYQRAARVLQAECGLKYTTAYQWVRENWDAIIETMGGNWKELGPAACGVWRRQHG